MQMGLFGVRQRLRGLRAGAMGRHGGGDSAVVLRLAILRLAVLGSHRVLGRNRRGGGVRPGGPDKKGGNTD